MAGELPRLARELPRLAGELPRVARRVDPAAHRARAYSVDVADLTEPCPNCGTMMRWETSHERCDGCGWIRPCCEGAPCN